MRRSKHNLSFQKNTTFNMGQLVPVGCVPVLPGDVFQHQTSVLMRLSPTLSPVMHTVDVRLHHFYVPNRLLWYKGTDAAPNDEGFENFITGGPLGDDVQTVPTFTTGATNNAKGQLPDHLGVPTGTTGLSINSLPLRAVKLCYNEWYRDQDLVTELDVFDDTADFDPPRIAWEKDYYSSARPTEQKGSDVSIPLSGGSADVHTAAGLGQNPGIYSDGDTAYKHLDSDAALVDVSASNANAETYKLYASLTGIDAIDVNDLRLGLALQRFKERRSMYGSRYSEYLASLGVNSSDARINRPEYLGGGREQIAFSEVLNTAATAANDLGEFGGHGISAMRSNRYRNYFEEHGYVITFMSVRPRAMYVDACPKEFLRQDKEDFYQKELELVGQQEILNKEVYLPHTTPEGVFGYADRYREYREMPSQVSGDFRDTVLNHWHLARDLTADPSLNQTFIECNPSQRIFAVSTDDVLWCTVYHRLAARRMVLRKPQPRIF